MEKMFEGKTALVTGGNSGIGKAIAEAFAAQGARVMITGRKLDTLEQMAKSNPNTTYVQGDMTEDKTIKEIMDKINSEFDGQLNILVNNAGWCPVAPITEIKIEDYNAAFDLDVRAVVNMTINALPAIIESKGCIINLSSLGAEHPARNLSLYTGAKAAIENFTRVWAVELADKGVRVNAIAPGAIETNIWNVPGLTKEQSEAHEKHITSTIPMGRMGKPEEIANVAVFLASPLASYVTGSIYAADGGAAWSA